MADRDENASGEHARAHASVVGPPVGDPATYRALARRIDVERSEMTQPRLGDASAGAAALLATAFPAFFSPLERDPEQVPPPLPFDPEAFVERVRPSSDEDEVTFRRRLRVTSRQERMRIALRELLPESDGGADVMETAAELSDLADATLEAALAEATTAIGQRLHHPHTADGDRSQLVVIGMGKLGGRELNAGSDVDLICVYDTDAAESEGASAHKFWTKVVQRMTETLAEVTEDGFVWRVDHRLRPEGARGPLVNSVAALERYYESFGRLWERAAWLRARPVAGDAALGARILSILSPFVWTRRVDPSVADALLDLVERARAERRGEADDDLKLRRGGIREAEFFVQALQLIWGGRDPRVRDRATMTAAERLRVAGYATDREVDEVLDAYVTLRRVEHGVQWYTGVQTHRLPHRDEDRDRIARALGYPDGSAMVSDLEGHAARVAAQLRSLVAHEAPVPRWHAALQILGGDDEEAFVSALTEAGMPGMRHSQGQLARDLLHVAQFHIDGLLGSRTRERHEPFVTLVLDALADAADPVLAARQLRGVTPRLHPPAVYTKLLLDAPEAVRRLITVLGGSAFIGQAIAARSDLVDLVLFDRSLPDERDAARDMEAARCAPDGEDAIEEQVATIRQAKLRQTTRVALADLAGDIDTTEATRILSTLADGALEAAARFALHTPPGEPVRGLAIIAMGKLGGRAIGYGSDLDVIFVFDPAAPRDPKLPKADDPIAFYARAARRIIQIVSMASPAGQGYELDTRLRPSGSQGLLVASIKSFARYHAATGGEGPSSGPGAATWERLALLRARFAAGDPGLGGRVMDIASFAAFERPLSLPRLAKDMRSLRERMREELAREREGRFDLKWGRGGLVDAEFAVQLLQLMHRQEPSLRTPVTAEALSALARLDVLPTDVLSALEEGYELLRLLQQRLRVVHNTPKDLIEDRAAGLVPLARRMGMHDLPAQRVGSALIDRYRLHADRIHAAYEWVLTACARGG